MTISKYTARLLVKSLLIAMALAVLMPQSAEAGDVTLKWTNATENTDGSLIATDTSNPGALATTTLYWGSCLADDNPAPPLLEMTVPTVVPGQAEEATVIITTPGRWCFVGVHANYAGSVSDYSNPVFKDVYDIPQPPSNLVVTELMAYYVIQQVNKFILLPVGTVPAGTACDSTEYVNGYYVVPTDQVIWSGTIRPFVVVAQCG